MVTGLGALTPLGPTRETTWDGLIAGRSGIGPITRFDTTGHYCKVGGEAKDFDPLVALERKEARHLDRFAQFLVVAAQEAMADSGLDLDQEDRTLIGVATATGIGGIETLLREDHVLETRGPGRVSPHMIPMIMSNAGAGYLALRYHVQGPNLTTVTACSSSAHAVGEAARYIARGDAEIMIAGGSEAVLIPFAFAGFEAMRALSRRNDAPEKACRPFDKERDGLVMGEGGAVLILEERQRALRRGARIYAELVGYGMSADAHHMVEPHPDGSGAALAMRRALEDAALPPSAIGYVNAHGTSTVKGDIAETQAIRTTFGAHADRLAISSTKSMHGHLLGAAGALELLICCLAVDRGILPPTVNLEYPDPLCDLDYVPIYARHSTVSAAMSNSFAFGGHNVSLIVVHPEAVPA